LRRLRLREEETGTTNEIRILILDTEEPSRVFHLWGGGKGGKKGDGKWHWGGGGETNLLEKEKGTKGLLFTAIVVVHREQLFE